MSFPAQPYNNPYFSIEIMHVPSKNQIGFDGFVTNFVDSFNSEWNETSVYGRMDPLATFQRTGRKIQLAFDVVARSAGEARLNDAKINRLIQFLYPVYESGNPDAQNVMTSAPLLRLKWANMINRGHTGTVETAGLLGYLRGLDYTPQLNAGAFLSAGVTKLTGVEALGARGVGEQTGFQGLGAKDIGKYDVEANPASAGMIAAAAAGNQAALDGRTKKQAKAGAVAQAEAIYMEHTAGTNAMAMYPQQISLSFAFSVIHEHLPGWTASGYSGGRSFPHGTSEGAPASDADLRGGLAIDGREQKTVDTTAGRMLTNTESNQITRKEFEARVQQITGEAFLTTESGLGDADFTRGGRRYFSAGR